MFSPTTKDVEEKSIFRNLMNMKRGEDWRRVRHVSTPTFTTGKLKRLIPAMAQSGETLYKAMDKMIEEGRDIPLKE